MKTSNRYNIQSGVDEVAVDRVASALYAAATCGYYQHTMVRSVADLEPPGADTMRLGPEPARMDAWRDLARRLLRSIS